MFKAGAEDADAVNTGVPKAEGVPADRQNSDVGTDGTNVGGMSHSFFA
jgi:hypothetical protein